jgi:hypothetical protein
LYGDFAFKTFDENRKRQKANTALYEAQMLSIDAINPTLEQIDAIDKNEVINRLERLLGNPDFYNTITKATTDKNVVTKRITDYTEFLHSIL